MQWQDQGNVKVKSQSDKEKQQKFNTCITEEHGSYTHRPDGPQHPTYQSQYLGKSERHPVTAGKGDKLNLHR